jgi:DNA-directed RNA polymerase subunit M/transcription elongation factor TFIIS
MAWTEQCKIHFKTIADAKYFKNGSKGIVRILRALSKESGIPYETLKRWYYEQEIVKNDNRPQGAKNIAKNESVGSASSAIPPTICLKCGENKVEKYSKTKKPASESSEYFGLCSSCRKKKTDIKKNIVSKIQEDIPIACPKCNHEYYLGRDELKKWIKN